MIHLVIRYSLEFMPKLVAAVVVSLQELYTHLVFVAAFFPKYVN